MNPLLRLHRKLTPVKAAMMTMMRPSFRVPSSRSIGICSELLDLTSSAARELAGGGADAEIEFRGGVDKNSFLLGTSSIADRSSAMIA